jgi:hypothetical protein
MYVVWILIECVICLGVICVCVCHRFWRTGEEATGEEAQIAALQARRDVLRQEYLSGIAAIDKELMRIYQVTDRIMEADF